MSEKIKQIAARIKELRRISGLSSEQLAKEFKIDPGQYTKYEEGLSDIPVGLLYELSRKFNVELTTLLTGTDPHLHTYSVVKKESAPACDRRKEYKYQDLAFNFAHKKAEVFLVCAQPHLKDDKQNFYTHPGQEFNYVLEGTLKVILDTHEVILETGDSLYFDSGIKHAMVAQNRKPAKFLAVII